MSIASRITSIEEHIGNAYDSIKKFGVDTSVINRNIENIANVINDDIYNKLPKVTVTGQGLTISDVQNGQVDDFKMIGVDLEQDTTTGKNILPQNEYISSTTINGITYTNNGDGTFSLSGTATAETSIRIIPTEKFNLNNGQQYYLYSSIPYNSSTFNMSIVTLENGTQNYLIVNNNYTPATTPTNSRLQFYIAQGNTVNAQNIKLMLVKGNNDTNYEPYTGGIPSPNPDYPQEIKVVEGRQVITDKGKNLLNPYTEPTERYGITASYNQNTHVYTFNGTCTRDNVTFILSNNKINFTTQVTKSITFWVGGSCTNSCDIRHFDSNYNSSVIYSIVNISSTNNKISKTSNYTFESPINYATIRFNNGSVANNLQIKVMVTDDDNTDYEPYYNPVSYNIDLHGKNVFNLEKYPFTPKVAYSSTGYQELNWTGYSGIKDYFPINGNTTYSFSNSTGLDIYYGLVFYDKNKTIISNITAHTTTFTTPSNCEYIRFSIHTEELPTWVQIEEGSTTTNYEEYYDYKLAKMPNTNYKNRIYKNNGNWYYEKNVEKYIIDGTESWTTQSAYSGYYRYMFVLMENYKNDNLSYGVVGMNSHFIQRITQPHGDYEYLYLQAANNNLLSVYIQIKNLSTIANFKTWLSENNVVVWYVLANPVTTQITNTTLINQLEAISVHTGTNIFTISNDNNIIPEIEITRLKELEKLA